MPEGTTLSLGQKPNELWCTDYKGEFLLGDVGILYPLTVARIMPRGICSCAKLWNPRKKRWLLRRLSVYFRNAACPPRSVQTMVYPSRRVIRYSISAGSRCGGLVWASASKGSGPAVPSRTGDTNACISRSKKEATRPPGLNSLQQQARFDQFHRGV